MSLDCNQELDHLYHDLHARAPAPSNSRSSLGLLRTLFEFPPRLSASDAPAVASLVVFRRRFRHRTLCLLERESVSGKGVVHIVLPVLLGSPLVFSRHALTTIYSLS